MKRGLGSVAGTGESLERLLLSSAISFLKYSCMDVTSPMICKKLALLSMLEELTVLFSSGPSSAALLAALGRGQALLSPAALFSAGLLRPLLGYDGGWVSLELGLLGLSGPRAVPFRCVKVQSSTGQCLSCGEFLQSLGWKNSHLFPFVHPNLEFVPCPHYLWHSFG